MKVAGCLLIEKLTGFSSTTGQSCAGNCARIVLVQNAAPQAPAVGSSSAPLAVPTAGSAPSSFELFRVRHLGHLPVIPSLLVLPGFDNFGAYVLSTERQQQRDARA
jgi:hypothetical protein